MLNHEAEKAMMDILTSELFEANCSPIGHMQGRSRVRCGRQSSPPLVFFNMFDETVNDWATAAEWTRESASARLRTVVKEAWDTRMIRTVDETREALHKCRS
jgi:hypothetical protein